MVKLGPIEPPTCDAAAPPPPPVLAVPSVAVAFPLVGLVGLPPPSPLPPPPGPPGETPIAL